ncbi:MAG TPA: hypothetical protein VLZ84_07160 [Asticcacaulis sp.]|nr:hypothetical protein [Asticcacaulis sp.]
MTLSQIAAAVEFEAAMLRICRKRGLPLNRAEHRRELLMLEAQIICRMNARPSNVVALADFRRVS